MSARVARCHASDRWIACTDDKSRDGTRRERMPRRMRECTHSTTDDTELLDVKSRERERWVVMGVSCDVTGTPGRRRPPTRDGACGGPLSQDRTRVDAPLSHVFTHCSHITRYPVRPNVQVYSSCVTCRHASLLAGRASVLALALGLARFTALDLALAPSPCAWLSIRSRVTGLSVPLSGRSCEAKEWSGVTGLYNRSKKRSKRFGIG